MKMHEDFEYERNKKIKISIVFLFFVMITLFLIATFWGIKNSDKKTSPIDKRSIDYATRGNILSSQDIAFTYSKTLYKVVIYKKYLDENKKDILINLFSKYTGIDRDFLREKLYEDSKSIVFSRNIDTKTAKNIKELKYDLQRFKVFRPIKKGSSFYQSIDISKNSESRVYPLKDTLEPYLGYVHIDEKGELFGVYGMEKYYNKLLKNSRNKMLQGNRDRQGIIIRDKNNKLVKKEDGFDILTNINLVLQKKIENILSKQKQIIGDENTEIIAGVMDSYSGKLIAIASSRRYNPEEHKIMEKLTISAIRRVYEPGSVIKPIFLSLLLEDKKTNLKEIVNTHNGRIKLSNGHTVKDEHRYPFLSVKDVIVHSSNVGMTELSYRAKPLKIIDGFKKFGFTKKSGIDLAYELSGSMPSVDKMQNSIVRANISYGYKLRANFFQLLSAYGVFNNGGYRVTPRIASIKITENGKREWIENIKPVKVLSKEVAWKMHRVLNSVVTRGTGKGTFIDGLDIGGKTGTAQIVEKRVYIKKYNSSFFGFANDKKHHFSIGVVVFEPRSEGYVHFASKSAVPTFKKIVEALIEQGLLKPLAP